MNVFHLAIPTHDLDAAEAFYTEVIGAEKARRYEDRVTFKFFEHQIVCHLAPDKVDQTVEIYPRHFGITFTDKEKYDDFYNGCYQDPSVFVKERFVRWPEKAEKHESFLLRDPSNNVLEFKYYYCPEFIY